MAIRGNKHPRYPQFSFIKWLLVHLTVIHLEPDTITIMINNDILFMIRINEDKARLIVKNIIHILYSQVSSICPDRSIFFTMLISLYLEGWEYQKSDSAVSLIQGIVCFEYVLLDPFWYLCYFLLGFIYAFKKFI